MTLFELWPSLSVGNRISVRTVLDGEVWRGMMPADRACPEKYAGREVYSIGADYYGLDILLRKEESVESGFGSLPFSDIDQEDL